MAVKTQQLDISVNLDLFDENSARENHTIIVAKSLLKSFVSKISGGMSE